MLGNTRKVGQMLISIKMLLVYRAEELGPLGRSGADIWPHRSSSDNHQHKLELQCLIREVVAQDASLQSTYIYIAIVMYNRHSNCTRASRGLEPRLGAGQRGGQSQQ